MSLIRHRKIFYLQKGYMRSNWIQLRLAPTNLIKSTHTVTVYAYIPPITLSNLFINGFRYFSKHSGQPQLLSFIISAALYISRLPVILPERNIRNRFPVFGEIQFQLPIAFVIFFQVLSIPNQAFLSAIRREQPCTC